MPTDQTWVKLEPVTAVAARKQCVWAGDIYSPKNAAQRWVLGRLAALQMQRESAFLYASAAQMGFLCFFWLRWTLTFSEVDEQIIHNRADMEIVGRMRWEYVKARLFRIHVPYEP